MNDRLFNYANEQQGFFTAQQAFDCGVEPSKFAEEFYPGVFQLRYYPSYFRAEVMAAYLAVGNAVVSHESALELHDLSDVIPNVTSLTVRFDAQPLQGVKIYKRITTPPFVIIDGMKVTTPIRTINDCLVAGTGREQLEMALEQAMNRAIITSNDIKEYNNGLFAGLYNNYLHRNSSLDFMEPVWIIIVNNEDPTFYDNKFFAREIFNAFEGPGEILLISPGKKVERIKK